MASEDVKNQIPAPAESEPANGASDQEAAKPTSSPSVFVNSEPIRPEQVENAVKFLSHPKVKGSPVMYRRSFLEKKGLSKEEIDEAFRRVPDSSPTAPAATISQDAQAKTVSYTQGATQTQQPAAAAPVGVVSRVMSRPRFHWTHAVYAIGILAVSGVCTAIILKKAVAPRLKSWIRKIVSEDENRVAPENDPKPPSVAEEAAAAAKSAADAASQVAKMSQEMMNTNIEDKRYFRNMMDMLDLQLQEMKSMNISIRKLEVQNNSGVVSTYDQEYRVSSSKQRQPYANGKSEFNSLSGRSSTPPAPADSSAPPHPKSYTEIMAMVQRGERPPNVKDIDDSPPNPNQQIPNSRVAPRSKPWEAAQAPNISSSYQMDANSNQLNGDSSTSWWQRKNVRITEVEEDANVAQYYNSRAIEQPVRSSWVPPQPPPIAMAEAAEAIRRPKPTVQTEQQQLSDEQAVAQSSDELERITKTAETGGEALKTNGVTSETSQSEMTEVPMGLPLEQNY